MRASKHCKFVLEGGVIHPQPVLVNRLMGMIFGVRRREEGCETLAWEAAAKTPVRLLRDQMKSMGWEEEDEFAWTHQALQEGINLNLLEGEEGRPIKSRMKSTKKRLGTLGEGGIQSQSMATFLDTVEET